MCGVCVRVTLLASYRAICVYLCRGLASLERPAFLKHKDKENYTACRFFFNRYSPGHVQGSVQVHRRIMICSTQIQCAYTRNPPISFFACISSERVHIVVWYSVFLLLRRGDALNPTEESTSDGGSAQYAFAYCTCGVTHALSASCVHVSPLGATMSGRGLL